MITLSASFLLIYFGFGKLKIGDLLSAFTFICYGVQWCIYIFIKLLFINKKYEGFFLYFWGLAILLMTLANYKITSLIKMIYFLQVISFWLTSYENIVGNDGFYWPVTICSFLSGMFAFSQIYKNA